MIYFVPMKTTREQAVDLYSQGIPVWQICQRLGVTNPTVYAWLKAAGVKPNRKRILEPQPNA